MGEDTAQALTIAEVCERLRLDRRTVYRLIERGELRAKRIGRVWRVPMAALLEYLAANGNHDTPQEGEKAGRALALA